MHEIKTRALVINRINYSETDKIITVLTKDKGKISLMVKGLRKQKSRYKGLMELFNDLEIIYKPNRGQIYHLVNVSLVEVYNYLITDFDRLEIAYFFLKVMNRSVEDNADASYFNLLNKSLQGLNSPNVNPKLVKLWFLFNFLALSGNLPSLKILKNGLLMQEKDIYSFNFDDFYFELSSGIDGFNSADIKFFRLLISIDDFNLLNSIKKQTLLVNKSIALAESIFYSCIQV